MASGMLMDTSGESIIWKLGNLVMWKSLSCRFPHFRIPTFPNYTLLLRGGRIEALDDFVRDVQSRVIVGGARIGDAEYRVQPLLLRDLGDHRDQALLELPLQLVLEILELGLGGGLRELNVALELVDLLVERRARRVVQHRAAGVALGRERLELLVLVVQLAQLLVVEVGEPLRRILARRRAPRDQVHVDERDLRVGGEREGGPRRGRRGSRRRGGGQLWRRGRPGARLGGTRE